MEFNLLPDLLNNGLTIIEFGLFYGGKHLRAKYMQIPDFFDNISSRKRFLVVTKSEMTMCENTSNTGWVLLMFYVMYAVCFASCIILYRQSVVYL